MRKLLFLILILNVIFIPYEICAQDAIPIVFNKDSTGKFIYCNNPEAIGIENLSDGPEPELLYHEKEAQSGKYTLMAEHCNHVSEPVTLDIQFYAPEHAVVEITALGVQVPLVESWACAEAYSDYMQMDFAHRDGYNYKRFNPTGVESNVVYELNSSNPTVWLSDIYTKIYDDSTYPRMPAKRNDYYTCMYIIMDFEILEGKADVNVAAYRNKANHSINSSNGRYYWDRMHKGISENSAEVRSPVNVALTDDTPDGELTVRVYNEYNPDGFDTTEWITNLNPQSDSFVKDICAQSDMLGFVYNDGTKLSYYGSEVPESEKDPNWYFDVWHGDNPYAVVSKNLNNRGFWQYAAASAVPPAFKPNDVLEYAPYQSATEITNFDLACSLGNYSVKTYYDVYVTNTGTKDRSFEYWLETISNNMVAVFVPGEDSVYYGAKGEYNGKQCMYSAGIPAGGTKHFVIMQVLPTGNVGGMRNSFAVSTKGE